MGGAAVGKASTRPPSRNGANRRPVRLLVVNITIGFFSTSGQFTRVMSVLRESRRSTLLPYPINRGRWGRITYEKTSATVVSFFSFLFPVLATSHACAMLTPEPLCRCGSWPPANSPTNAARVPAGLLSECSPKKTYDQKPLVLWMRKYSRSIWKLFDSSLI
jgi:hypothetical protein